MYVCVHARGMPKEARRGSQHPLGLGLQVVVSYQGLAVLILGDCQFKSGFKNETLSSKCIRLSAEIVTHV